MRTGKLKTNNGCLVWLFLGPSLLGFSLFYLLPFVTGFYYSLVDSPINGTLVGLHNYGALLKNPSFLSALANTAKFTLICVPLMRNAKSIISRADIHDFRLNDVRGKELRDMTIGVIGNRTHWRGSYGQAAGLWLPHISL